MTVVGGASGAKINVPSPTPGPRPEDPAISVRPTGKPRLCAEIVVPRVKVILALIRISRPAHSAILPSVVVIAKNTFTSWPALSRMLPLVVVTGAFTFTSRPQQATRLPLVAVMAALMFTSRNAFSVSVVDVPDAVQDTASLTKMSPLPPVLSPVDASVLIVTFVVTNCADSVAPEMSPPAPIMKSLGSISQVPLVPSGASVVIRTLLAILSVAAEVSMKPPFPPLDALASSTPATSIVPLCRSPSSLISPLRFSSVRASITPLLLTAVRSNCPAA